MLIYQHLGLGDHIICNGLVRTLAENSPIELLCKKQNAATVEFMFRDDKRITVVPVKDDVEANSIFAASGGNKLKIGHGSLHRYMAGGKQFDEAFYAQCGIDFQERWRSFRCDRDADREWKLYWRLWQEVHQKNYVFVHDDASRGFVIGADLAGKTVIRPRVGLTDNLFDYCRVMEGADEVHCIDSSFRTMADSLLALNKPFLWLAFDNGVKDFSVARPKIGWETDIKDFDYSSYLYTK